MDSSEGMYRSRATFLHASQSAWHTDSLAELVTIDQHAAEDRKSAHNRADEANEGIRKMRKERWRKKSEDKKKSWRRPTFPPVDWQYHWRWRS